MLLPWIVLIIEGMFCSIIVNTSTENNGILCAVIIFINVLSVIATIVNQKKSLSTTTIMLCGLLFRLFLFIWDINYSDVYMLPNSGQDTEMFANTAREGFLYGDYGRGGIYAKFLAFWFRLFGSVQRPIAQYTNILLAITIILLTIKIMRYLLVPEKSQTLIIAMLSFLPNVAITNSILLRETLIIFLLTVAAWFFIVWINQGNLYNILLSVVFICFASAVHSGAVAILLGESIVFILYDRKTKKICFNSKSFLGIVIVLFTFIFIYTQFGDVLFGKFNGRIDSVESIMATADTYNRGGASYDAGFEINNSIVSLIVNTPIRMFYFVAAPLPWDWRGVSDIIAFCFSSIIFIYIYYRTYQEIRRGSDKYKTLIIIFTILALSSALIFAWGVSNAGTAVRHREKFISIYMILLSLCEANRYYRRQKQ